jgi:hypothetical protein
MEEVVHPLIALMICFCLSHFIVVVRKHQINTIDKRRKRKVEGLSE